MRHGIVILRAMVATTSGAIGFWYGTHVFEPAVGIGASPELISHTNGMRGSLHLDC